MECVLHGLWVPSLPATPGKGEHLDMLWQLSSPFTPQNSLVKVSGSCLRLALCRLLCEPGSGRLSLRPWEALGKPHLSVQPGWLVRWVE